MLRKIYSLKIVFEKKLINTGQNLYIPVHQVVKLQAFGSQFY